MLDRWLRQQFNAGTVTEDIPKENIPRFAADMASEPEHIAKDGNSLDAPMDEQYHAKEQVTVANVESPPSNITQAVNRPVQAQATEENLQEIQREMTAFERSTLRWAKVAVLLSGLAAIFVCLQWIEMRTTGTDTHTLAERTKDLADRMKDQADQAKIIAKATQSAADTASETLKQMRGSFVTEQRPYLIADTPVFVRSPAVDQKPIEVNISFKNLGRTPAIKRRIELDLLRFRAVRKTNDPAKDAPGIERYFRFIEAAFESLNKRANNPGGKYGPLAREDIAPGALPFSTAINETAMTTDELRDLQEGGLAIFLVGISRYTDGFYGKYQTDFCWFYFGPDPKMWHICDSHNVIK